MPFCAFSSEFHGGWCLFVLRSERTHRYLIVNSGMLIVRGRADDRKLEQDPGHQINKSQIRTLVGAFNAMLSIFV